jgi:uncharacterized protein (TIGR03435 family)
MVQRLLLERFKLRIHRETKEMPIYALARGNSGSKLQRWTTPCGADGCIDVAPGKIIARFATFPSIAVTVSNFVPGLLPSGELDIPCPPGI